MDAPSSGASRAASSGIGAETGFHFARSRSKLMANRPWDLMSDAVLPADITAMSFEAALAELEKIVGQLESGQAPLEQSIELYERGAALKAHCETRLEAARLRVEKIVVGPSGAVAVEPAEFS